MNCTDVGEKCIEHSFVVGSRRIDKTHSHRIPPCSKWIVPMLAKCIEHSLVAGSQQQRQPPPLPFCQINNAITRIISISVNGGRCELTCVRMYVINNAITQLISIWVNGGLANLRNAQNIILVYIRQPLAAAIMSWVPSIMVWRSAAAIAAPH